MRVADDGFAAAFQQHTHPDEKKKAQQRQAPRHRRILDGVDGRLPFFPHTYRHKHLHTVVEKIPAPSVDEEVYEGTVKLMIKSAGYIRAMIRFVDELRNNQHFHLLRLTADQRREGMDIWLRLREPMPLRTILLEIEGVSEVAAPNGIDTDSNERQLKVSLG